jgi:hypothetical protein
MQYARDHTHAIELTGARTVAIFTHYGIDYGIAKMPMALQTQRYKGVKIFKANARRMVSNATTRRETSADDTTRIHKHPQETRLWRRQIKRRDYSVEIDLPGRWKCGIQARLSSRLIHESPRALNAHERQMTIDKIGLDRRLTVRKQKKLRD